jgi:outer membrane immunogenic protein
MKKLLTLAVVGVAASTTAYAADMPLRAPMPVAVGYDWSGFYVGGNVGWGFQSTDFNDPTSAQIAQNGLPIGIGLTNLFGNVPSQNLQNNSLLGGFQAGANYQIARFVIGGEFDMSWGRLNSSMSAGLPSNFALIAPGLTFTDTEAFQQRTNWIATTTARFGVAQDNWLFYGKIGAAFEDNTYTLTHFASIAIPVALNNSFSSTMSDIRVGFTVGAGVEWAFASHWTAKLEYDFMDFGTKAEGMNGTNTISGVALPPGFPATAATTASPNLSQQVSEVKFGINYKFASGMFPW